MICKITNINNYIDIQKTQQNQPTNNTGFVKNDGKILLSDLHMQAMKNLYQVNFKGTEQVKHSTNNAKKQIFEKLKEIENKHNNFELSLRSSNNIIVNRVKEYNIKNKSILHKTVGLVEEIIDVVKEAENAQINLSLEKIEETLENSKTQKFFIEVLKNKIDFLKTANAGQYYNEKYQIVEKVLKNTLNSNGINQNDLIKKYIDIDMYYFYNLINLLTNKNEYIDEILNLIENTPRNNEEKLSQYLEKIIKLHTIQTTKNKEEFDLKIKSNLSYDFTSKQNKNITVTPYTHNLLAKAINNIYQTKRYDTDTPVKELSKLWANKYIDGIMVNLEKNLSEIVFTYFPKHNPENIKNETVFDYPPVYRWLKINDINTFLSDFQNENTTYKYKKIQSCSTQKNYGEYNSTTGNVNFADWDSQYNVKFVIHPKNNNSNAVVIGDNKYGNSEVLYSANQEFKYLGKTKHIVNPSDYETLTEFDKSKQDPFYRWEIHLQEL